ncbi:uncharacterized protein LOC113302429 [Papaver somniferum]|uniref:uncharacterized protein LOC113302429 n=1 Tax=Papaver somniferum TaxID=3469 RepID=UPI000E6FE6A4|nr:uncharacterized protein LOC113302429 [Papaver somniferum]
MYDPFAFTKKNEVLLWYGESGKYPDDYNHNLLFIYDCDQDVSDDGYGSEDGHGYGCGYVHIDQFATAFMHLEAIPHLNSFISLEALGEGDVNKLPYAEELLDSDMSESNSEASSEEDDEYICDNCKSSWVEEADGEEEYHEDEDDEDED